MIAEYILLPFAQSLLYDSFKIVLREATTNFRIKKALDSAIKKGVKSALKKANPNLVDSICTTIIDCNNNNIEPDIKEILTREFEQWNEQNYDITFTASDICNRIVKYIAADENLSDLFTVNTLNIIKNNIDTIKNNFFENHTVTNNKLDALLNDNISIKDYLYNILSILQNLKNDVSDSKATAMLISDTYKNHFKNPLFLEKTLNDGKIATLNDVYIENDFYILDFPYHNTNKKYTKIIDFISDYIRSNLLSFNYSTPYSNDSLNLKVLFVKGHPGSGKSSLFFKLAFLKSNDETFFPDYHFHFIKLIDIYESLNGNISVDDPLRDIENYVGTNLSFKKKTVLILDGLDEICVAKNFNIYEYCNNLIRIVTSQHFNVKIIITTRLNYINIPNSENKNVINIQLEPLSVDDLREWINKYFNIHKTLLKEKNIAQKNLRYLEKQKDSCDSLTQIFAIPLLFYMIVTSKIDISKINHIGELYDHVFKELKERNYNESDIDFRQKHSVNQKISPDLARQIAIEISHTMYTENKLLLNIDSKKLKLALNRAHESKHNFKNADKKDIELLFPITFFYKESNDVVEFAHKSIMEFFAGEKIFQIINSDNYRDFNSFINDYFLNPIITNEVLGFISYFIKSRPIKLDNTFFDNILLDFKNMIIKKIEFSNSNVTYNFETCKIVFKSYWYFIRYFIQNGEYFIQYKDLDDLINQDIVKNYILGILSINNTNAVPFLDNSVINLDFSNLSFDNYNFSYSDLSYTNFSNAKIKNCQFKSCNIENSNFNAIKVKEQLTLANCFIQNSTFSNIKAYYNKNMTNLRKSKNKAKEHIITFSKCIWTNVFFENTDISFMRFSPISQLQDIKFKNTIFNADQFDYICSNENLQLEGKITVVLRQNDFSKNARKYINECAISSREKLIIELFETSPNRLIPPHILNNVSYEIKDFIISKKDNA